MALREGAAGLCLAAALLWAGCAASRQRPAMGPKAPAEAAFLPSPLAGLEPDRAEAGDAAAAAALREAHARLLAGADPAAVRAIAEGWLARSPALAPARVLVAQADLVARRYAEVLTAVTDLAASRPLYPAAQLVVGRAAELAGDLSTALDAYLRIADTDALAGQRAAAVRPRALEVAGNRFRASLAAGDLAAAEEAAARLARWAPHEAATLLAAADLAAARGDGAAELAALRGMAAAGGGDRTLTERRADLELAAGDVGSGLALFEDLAARAPGDPTLAAKLGRARSLWRLEMMPSEVRRLARTESLDRAGLAVLLYWLFPGVRYGSGGGRIASDVLDHPQKDRIVRVVNSGVLDIDPVLHRFEPARPATRGETLEALLRVLARARPPAACAAVPPGPRPAAPQLCAAAAACGLVAAAECRPAAGASGAWALEASQVALDRLAAAGR